MKIEKKKIYCPIGDISCPYFSQEGFCNLEKPWENCDDYYGMVGDEDETSDDPCIGCPHEGHGSEHCAAEIGDYCRAGNCFIEDEE